MFKEYDDYAWSDYTPTYADTHEKWKGGEHYLRDGDFEIKPDGITFKVPICDNIKQVIHQILINRSNVRSVYECGCGAGWNSANILKVFPYLDVNGSDINPDQFVFGRKHFAEHGYTDLPGFHDRLSVVDFSSPEAPERVGMKHDLVFCQAVTMHLRDDRAVQFIQNMAALSNRYVMLCENGAWQDYPTLFQQAGIKEQFTMTCTTGPFAVGMFFFEKKPV